MSVTRRARIALKPQHGVLWSLEQEHVVRYDIEYDTYEIIRYEFSGNTKNTNRRVSSILFRTACACVVGANE